jgi:type IV pilus assembly protein PilO
MKLAFDHPDFKGFLSRYGKWLIIVTNLLVAGVVFYFLLLPQYEEKERLRNQQNELAKELADLATIQQNMKRFRQEYKELQVTLQNALDQLPEKKDVPNILRAVSAAGGETRVKIRYFEPKPTIARDFYAELPVELRYSGAYHNLGHFFDEVRRMQRIVHIPVFSLEAKGPANKITIEGSCIAKTFLFVKEQPAPKKGK